MYKINEPESTKAAVRKLWKQCFNDTPEFIDLYFRTRYRDELNETIVCNDRVVSALQIIPYEMTSWGTRFPMAYLSGVCTHPDVRKQGLMRRLLEQTHRRLYADGYRVSTLIPAEPWLFGCYATSGYTPVFTYTWSQHAITPVESRLSVNEYRENHQGVYAYFCRKTAERPCGVLHSEADFRIVTEDLYLSEGYLLVARRDEKVVGLAFCVPDADVCRVNECLADSPAIGQALLNKACERCFTEQAEWIHPTRPGEEAHPLGMLRIIRAEEVLSLYAASHPDFTACWHVTDTAIEVNNGTFRLERGTCHRTSDEGTIMPVETLARHLWKEDNPYMSLMLN